MPPPIGNTVPFTSTDGILVADPFMLGGEMFNPMMQGSETNMLDFSVDDDVLMLGSTDTRMVVGRLQQAPVTDMDLIDLDLFGL